MLFAYRRLPNRAAARTWAQAWALSFDSNIVGQLLAYLSKMHNLGFSIESLPPEILLEIVNYVSLIYVKTSKKSTLIALQMQQRSSYRTYLVKKQTTKVSAWFPDGLVT